LGWRLGGKLAGGRNSQVGLRTEDHDSHVWYGFYDHAFHLVRRCYAELQRNADQP
jgi:uncharacterized protein with NAD-binding domain and iron-sulfur cluster